MGTVSEPDWKVFRAVREAALERFSRRILSDVDRFRRDESRSHHERYLDLYRWLQNRNDEMATAFDNPRRSQMLQQLATLVRLDLVEADEFAQFSTAAQEAVKNASQELGGLSS